MNRRGFLTGLVAFTAAAPAIVRSASLMQVRGIVLMPAPPGFASDMVRLQEHLNLHKSRMIYTLMHPSTYRILLEADVDRRLTGFGQIIQQEPELAEWQQGAWTT